MLDTAEKLLRQILDTLRPEIEAGTPFVGLEPSCVAVFRDEMLKLFPMDEDARRLGNNFLTQRVPGEEGDRFPSAQAPPQGPGAGALPSHHVMTLPTSNPCCAGMGLNYEMLDSGCCGMAGSFGFEAGHYDVSVAVGERVLLPAVPRGRGRPR